MDNTCHPSHKTRLSIDSSSYDEICVHCGATDSAAGGWGKLAEPCPSAPDDDVKALDALASVYPGDPDGTIREDIGDALRPVVTEEAVEAVMEMAWTMARCSSPQDRQHWAGKLRAALSATVPGVVEEYVHIGFMDEKGAVSVTDETGPVVYEHFKAVDRSLPGKPVLALYAARTALKGRAGSLDTEG